MSAKREYRVRWRREDRGQATPKLYQTLEGAEGCKRRLEQLDKLKRGWWPGVDDNDELAPGLSDTLNDPHADDDHYVKRFGDMPDIVDGPHLEYREVGEWTAT